MSTTEWQTLEPHFHSGPGRRARIGLLVLATDLAVEPDLMRFTELDGVACYTSRMPMALTVNSGTLSALESEVVTATTNLVPWASFDAIAFCCTSGSIAVGAEKIREMVQSVKPGVPVCNPIDAALEALQRLDCHRVALMTPYVHEVNETLDDYFARRGLGVTRRAAFGQDGDPDINRITPECLIAEAVKLGQGDCDSVFISCTGMMTSSVVQHVEDQIGKPVVTSNQALAWSVLRAAGVADAISGFGQLFQLDRSTG
ncbi:MAG: Asp/Glu racemase [Actinomycetia bacterium]|nr:Asp/Glu racemase [Actinomycetes bacterium]